MSKSILTIAVAALSLSIACQAEANGPTVRSWYQKDFTLESHQHLQVPVTLLQSTHYKIEATSPQNGKFQLKVDRYWNGQHKFHKYAYGHHDADLHFESTHHGDRPYVVTVSNKSGGTKRFSLTIRTSGSGGGGYPSPSPTPPPTRYVYDVQISADYFIGFKNTESGDEEYKPTYSARVGNRTLFDKTELFENAKPNRRFNCVGSGTARGVDGGATVTFRTSCKEEDNSPNPDDDLGRDDRSYTAQQLYSMYVQLSGNTSNSPVALRLGNSDYTMSFAYKVTRRSVPAQGQYPPSGPVFSQQTGNPARSQGQVNRSRQVISGSQRDVSNWFGRR